MPITIADTPSDKRVIKKDHILVSDFGISNPKTSKLLISDELTNIKYSLDKIMLEYSGDGLGFLFTAIASIRAFQERL